MPQIIIEYSGNLTQHHVIDADHLPAAINKALEAIGLCNEYDLKTVVHRCDTFGVGNETGNRAFVLAKIHILPGRTHELKCKVADATIHTIKENLRPVDGLDIQVVVDISEMDKPYFRKETLK